MLNWAVTFFVIAFFAAIFGFGGVAASAAPVAQLLFYIFAVLFVVTTVAHLVQSSGKRIS